jgi:D-methionine transport system ATP-binding protein
MIELHDVRKTFRQGAREVAALDGVDLRVERGAVYGVVGQSGAGKSTLVRTVNLLERPTAGRVVVDGQDVTALPAAGLRAARRRIGMVFQGFNLLSSRTAAGNVALPLEVAGVGRTERAARAAELLERVGLADHAGAHPAQLSGGQKQRVAIARALAARPAVLLSDEATSGLDPETTRSILALLRDLNRELGLTILLITHEMEVVKAICDGAALLEDGRIAERGSLADLIADPASRLGRALIPPVAGAGTPDGEAVFDVTYGHGSDPAWLSALSRGLGADVAVLGAAVEAVGGRPAGRVRIAIPAGADAARLPELLAARGLHAQAVEGR